MSQKNVELVRSLYDAVARDDVATLLDVYSESIVLDISNARRAPLLPKPVYRGHDEAQELSRAVLVAFGAVDLTVEELLDTGDQVVAVVREHYVGRGSGVPVEAVHFAVWTCVDDRVVQVRVFDDRANALAAAGQSE